MGTEAVAALCIGIVTGWTCCLVGFQVHVAGFRMHRAAVFIVVFAVATAAVGYATQGARGSVFAIVGILTGAGGHFVFRNELISRRGRHELTNIDQRGNEHASV